MTRLLFPAQIVNESIRVGINSAEAHENARFLLNVMH